MFLTSCGDLFMAKKSDDAGSFNQFATCKLDTKALARIGEEKITGDLICLKENLHLFIDVVKTDRPGNLSLKELKKYITKNISDIKPEVLESLGAIFDVNSLIYGDHPDYIAKENVDKLVNAFIDINEIIVSQKVFEYFSDKDDVSFKEHTRRRGIIFQALKAVGNRLSIEFVKNSRSIDIVSFLNRFKTEANGKKLDKFKSLLFVKRMFLGGQESLLGSADLKRLLDSLGEFGKVGYDLNHLPHIDDSNYEEVDLLILYKEAAEILVKNLYFKRNDSTAVMTLENVKDIVRNFVGIENQKWIKDAYDPTLLKVKKILFENDKKEFNGNEIHILFNDIISMNLKRGVFFYRAFEKNRDVLLSSEAITTPFDNVYIENDEEEKFLKDFNRIVMNYRYFRGKHFAASYSYDIKRNALGIFEISGIEVLMQKISESYCVEDASYGVGCNLRSRELVKALTDVSPVLEGEKISYPGRSQNSAETIALMSSLFQNQSDTNVNISVEEMSEFALGLFSSLQISGVVQDKISEVCTTDEKDRVLPECYRENFKELLLAGDDSEVMADRFINLNNFIHSASTDVSSYIREIELFTRSCTQFSDGVDVPVSSGDQFSIFSGMIAIEQIMIRFDLDRNGYLDYDEVDASFEIYKGAVTSLIPVGFLKPMAKTFFLYLMTYRKLPNISAIDDESKWQTWKRVAKEGIHFARFAARSKRKKKKLVNAAKPDRFTLATILKTLSAESATTKDFNRNNPNWCEFYR